MPIENQEAVDKVRRMTGVGATAYELDGTAYWTDEQIDALVTEHSSGTDPVVVDYEAVAADILEAWSAVLSLAYDMTVDGQTLNRSQMAKAIGERAAKYRDLAGGDGSDGGMTTVSLQAPL